MPKQKNIEKSESKFFKSKKVYCEGGIEDSGHPKIYLIIGENDDSVTCPYCGKIFTRLS